jgi:hypothetical protein
MPKHFSAGLWLVVGSFEARLQLAVVLPFQESGTPEWWVANN